jgi:hypothetical protein
MRSETKSVEAPRLAKLVEHVQVCPHVIDIVAVWGVLRTVPGVTQGRIFPNLALAKTFIVHAVESHDLLQE